MNHKILGILFFTLVTFTSCKFFTKNDERKPIARVNDSYLYLDDLNHVITEGVQKNDSILIVQNFIDKWATQQLLVDGALVNLKEDKQKMFNRLVKQYKNDLFGKAYLEALVKKNIDTVVLNEEAETYYVNNKSVFRLNEELLKLRYIHVDKDIINFDSIQKQFVRFNAKDKKDLDSIAIQFKSYSLNDSIWVKVNQVTTKIPIVNFIKREELLKKSNFIQLKDSLGVYLMQINDVLFRNDVAPLQYVKPTIDQIVINKRKLELISRLEKDITKDAIKNKEFEIYN